MGRVSGRLGESDPDSTESAGTGALQMMRGYSDVWSSRSMGDGMIWLLVIRVAGESDTRRKARQ